MMASLDRSWRVLATGLSFAVFGVGGLLLRVLVFPVLQLFVRAPQRRANCARAVVRLTFRAFVALMRGLGVLRYEITGLERLDRGGQLILANHPTLIDTVFLMAFVRRADCIVKSGLWNNPFTAGPVRAAGYISNAGGEELVEACIASLRAGNNLIIFPEGTRTPADGKLVMKRGAANIAVRGKCKITPVRIACTPRTLGKGDKWWRVPDRRVQFQIQVGDDIDAARLTPAGTSEVMAVRRLTEHLEHFFTGEWQGHA